VSEYLLFGVVKAHVELEVCLKAEVLAKTLILEILTELLLLLGEFQLSDFLLSLDLPAKLGKQLNC
jgi:hypothetical protein